MSARIPFPDPDAAADALTFAGRAARLGDGGVRLQAAGGTLAMTAAPLAPRGLLDPTPTILALRALPVDPELECDLVVEASALRAVDDVTLLLPDTAVSPAWAGISPPRGGWSAMSPIEASTLASRAQWGIAAVAEALPADPGEDVVRSVRATVWGEADAALHDLPRGTAFAAFAMGFIGGQEEARVREGGSWVRLTLDRGHVLVRRPVRSGLTAVRTTGAPRG
ncbi:hypothetical protein [Microbacterium sp. CJ88]|uniref:hypothetical protein n=1 Tax=Microbacterium sp. CJ88 TaxID=3445672 RepID=UPI003F65EA0D